MRRQCRRRGLDLLTSRRECARSPRPEARLGHAGGREGRPRAREAHQHRRHVVPTESASQPQIRRHTSVEEVLQDSHHRLRIIVASRLKVFADKVNDFLVGLDIPHTVAADHEELILLSPVVELHIRRCTDDLLFRLSARILLVLEVTQGSRKVEISIHAVLPWTRGLHITTSCLNPSPLRWIVGLVILAQGDCQAAAAEDRTAVTCVRHNQLVLRDTAEASCAADKVRIY
mmetsp:Transcript_137230/g.382800  ORF Transcript_137230/g.382800 Transcript_137230/m.382800 type:complete len:231 (-) Transcript_137230:533-1225(-)